MRQLCRYICGMDTSYILRLSETYCAEKSTSESRVSTLIFNQGMRIKRFRNGGGLTVASYNKAIQWFSDHWPLDLEWPHNIPRPAPTADSAAAKAVAEAKAKSPLTSLTDDGIIANPSAFCQAMYASRHTYDQAVRQYAIGKPREHRDAVQMPSGFMTC